MSQAGEVIQAGTGSTAFDGRFGKDWRKLVRAARRRLEPVPDEERQVLWHEVEQSTVKPSTEMMELIEASRAFEMNVTMIHTQDEVTGNA